MSMVLIWHVARRIMNVHGGPSVLLYLDVRGGVQWSVGTRTNRRGVCEIQVPVCRGEVQSEYCTEHFGRECREYLHGSAIPD
jgi:hypothetical protein